jgi:hypothetical protein
LTDDIKLPHTSEEGRRAYEEGCPLFRMQSEYAFIKSEFSPNPFEIRRSYTAQPSDLNGQFLVQPDADYDHHIYISAPFGKCIMDLGSVVPWAVYLTLNRQPSGSRV